MLVLATATIITISCGDDDDDTPPVQTELEIPTEYVSAAYATNSAVEGGVIDELSTLTSALNAAESDAQGANTVGAITYDANSTLAAVTQSNYKTLIDGWLVELVNAANDDDGFQNPGADNAPAAGEEGGKLGSRLLDENGLELEQMIQKGSFGAALYNHALTVVNQIKSGTETDPGAIDKLVEIHGTTDAFDGDPASDAATKTTAAATYSRRRSNFTTKTGAFWDIKTALITARAAMEAGSAFDTERDAALDAYLLAWEESNFATVIYYCLATKSQLQAAGTLSDGDEKDAALGNALHAYAEGVGFAHGFKRVATKKITDAQIDQVLADLLAAEGDTPTSFEFLNKVSLLQNLDDIVADLKAIYGFTDAQITDFEENDPGS